MRLLLKATAVVGFVVFTGSVGLSQSRSAAAPSIVGVWKGVDSVVTGASAYSNPNRQPMMIIYTAGGHFAVLAQDFAGRLQTPRKIPPPSRDPNNLTDAEKIARYELWAPVTAFGGRYEVKGNTITQRQILNKEGNLGMATFEFRLEAGGNTMIEIRRSPPGEPASELRRSYMRLE